MSIADPEYFSMTFDMEGFNNEIWIAMLGEWVVKDDVVTGRLKPLLPSYRVSTAAADGDVYVVFRQKQNLSIKIRTFIDFLAETLPAIVRSRSSLPD